MTDGKCPTGWYCPVYSSQQLTVTSFTETLNENGCYYGKEVVKYTGSADRAVMCPCPPGFFCPKNAANPMHCIEGFYCPADASIDKDPFGNPIPDSGLGSFGTLSYTCPEGKWCLNSQVQGFHCGTFGGGLNTCEEGSQAPSKIALYVLVAFAVGFFWVVFWFLDWRKSRRSQRDIESLEAQKSAYDPISGKVHSEFESAADAKEYLIQFENIGFVLPNGVEIMKKVSGSFKPRRLCAIMGPSGAGKTTVISLITGKEKKTSGKVLLNGEVVDGLGLIRKLLGFVPQEDVMIRELTVREIITFSASYRLPSSYTSQQIETAVNQCLLDLGMSHVQHSPIGDELTRGISGGQRKRVNIGIEMVAQPSILFLDEV